MSRIGNKPIPIPSGVDVKIQGSSVVVKGQKVSLRVHLIRALVWENLMVL